LSIEIAPVHPLSHWLVGHDFALGLAQSLGSRPRVAGNARDARTLIPDPAEGSD
jgi:hypothetical protein